VVLVLSAIILILSNSLNSISGTGSFTVSLITPRNGSTVTGNPITLEVSFTNTTNGNNRPISGVHTYFFVEAPQTSRYDRVGYAITGSDGYASYGNYNPPFAGTYSWYISAAIPHAGNWNNAPQNETKTGNAPWSFVTNSVSTQTTIATYYSGGTSISTVWQTTYYISTIWQNTYYAGGTSTYISYTGTTSTETDAYTVGLQTAYSILYQTIPQYTTQFATVTASFTSYVTTSTTSTVPLSTLTTPSTTAVTVTQSQTVVKSAIVTTYVYPNSMNTSGANPTSQATPQGFQDALVGVLKSLPLPIVGVIVAGMVGVTLFYRWRSNNVPSKIEDEGEEE
jgi:hypothetical protein